MAQKAAIKKKSLTKRVAEEAKKVVEAWEAKKKQAVEAREAAEKITPSLVERLNQGSQSPHDESEDYISLSWFFSAILNRGPETLPGQLGPSSSSSQRTVSEPH